MKWWWSSPGPDQLRIEHRRRGGCIIVTPVGTLNVRTYSQLRDALLKHAADEPAAVIVELHGLHAADPIALTVFPTVAMAISTWPDVPLLLAGATEELIPLLGAGAVSRFVPTHPTVAAALAALADPPPRRRSQIDLPFHPDAGRIARAWINAVCTEWGLAGEASRPIGDGLARTDGSARAGDATVETVTLVGSELVANMVVHARTAGRLRLELHPAGLSVAVSDDSDEPPVHRRPTTDEPGTGGGIELVDALATTWGYHPRRPCGKVIWAVLPTSPNLRTEEHVRIRTIDLTPTAARHSSVSPPASRTPSLPLRTGFALSRLDIHALWLRYVILGGGRSEIQLGAAMHAEDIPVTEYVLVARALNEHFEQSDSSYWIDQPDVG